LFWWKIWFLTIFTKFWVSWDTFWIFKKFPVVPPLLSLGYHAKGCILPKFFKTCFYQLKVIVLMTGKVLDNFQKVSSKFGYFLNFWKIYCGPPFQQRSTPRGACGPPPHGARGYMPVVLPCYGFFDLFLKNSNCNSIVSHFFLFQNFEWEELAFCWV
jgi:hypothetical protein